MEEVPALGTPQNTALVMGGLRLAALLRCVVLSPGSLDHPEDWRRCVQLGRIPKK